MGIMDVIKKVFANGMRIIGCVTCLIYGYQYFVRKGVENFSDYSIAVGLVAIVTLISYSLRNIGEYDNVILYKISKWSTTIMLIPLLVSFAESDLQAKSFIIICVFTIVFAVIKGIIEIFSYFNRSRDIDKRLDELEEEFDMSNLSAEERAEAQKNWVNHLTELEKEKKARTEALSIKKESVQRQKEETKKKGDDKVERASKTFSKEDGKLGYLARKIAEVQEKQRLEAEAKEAEKCYCKLCGCEYENPRTLLNNYCPSNKSGNRHHLLFEGSKRNKYVCLYCGREYDSIRSLVNNYCPQSPDGRNGKHVPFEGEPQSYYYCKHCGNKYKSIRYLTSEYCFKRPLDREGNRQHHEPRR